MYILPLKQNKTPFTITTTRLWDFLGDTVFTEELSCELGNKNKKQRENGSPVFHVFPVAVPAAYAAFGTPTNLRLA